MRRARGVVRGVLAAIALGALPGCVYFNGMYNAKKFASDAERSERAGRTSEARDRWVRAAMHAESLTSRHPNSRWVMEARLIRGRAMLHLESYSEATVELGTVLATATEPETRREAALLLGQSNLALRRYAQAEAALDTAVQSADRARRDQAFQARGRARLALRRPAEALRDFELSGARGIGFDRARVAMALGDAPRAARELQSEIAVRPFEEASWLGLLDSLAAVGADQPASVLVDRLVTAAVAGPGQRARLLLGDGDRHARGGRSGAAAARFRSAQALVPGSAEARVAQVRLAALALRVAEHDSSVAASREVLEGIEALGGTAGRDATALLRFLRRADTLAIVTDHRGAFRFARAEVLRDSLGMERYAAMAFAAIADSVPDSPWTPKALIAAIAAGHPHPDSLSGLLATRYAASPYAAVARGLNAPGYAALEDSLRAVLAAAPLAAGMPVNPNDDEPGPRRRRGAAPEGPGRTVRSPVPEPESGSRNPRP